MTNLTDQQQAGIERIQNWYTGTAPTLHRDGSWGAPVFRLFGWAGTGKTTMATRRGGREAAITQARQWAYTASTRASKRLTWARTGR